MCKKKAVQHTSLNPHPLVEQAPANLLLAMIIIINPFHALVKRRIWAHSSKESRKPRWYLKVVDINSPVPHCSTT